MAITQPLRTNYRTWNQILLNEYDGMHNPFTPYSEILNTIEIDQDYALQRMWELYETAVTNYTLSAIFQIFQSNYNANKDKYAQILEVFETNIYPFGDYYRNEAYDHTRTPNLTSTSSSTGSGTATTERKQTRSTTTTPNNYTTTTTHKVDPYDQTGLRNESQDLAVETGSRTTAESYSGQPDSTTTSNTASSTVGTTGTDKNNYTKIIFGRDGRRPTSEVIEDGMKAAAIYDVLDIIINDIADQIFLQTWIF